MKKYAAFVLAFVVEVVLVACGGGGGASVAPVATSTVNAAANPFVAQQVSTVLNAPATELRAKILSAPVASATPLEFGAETLLDFGEGQFPQYFPTHEASQVSAPFRYRYYPATGVYLGVAMKPGLGYFEGGVYVMGGPFGNQPLYVGQISDYVKQPAFLPKLMIGTNDPTAGYTVSSLDLASGSFTDLPLPKCGFASGFAFNSMTGKIKIACVGSPVNQFWWYDPVSGEVGVGPMLPVRYTFRSDVVCSQDGTCFYSRGLVNAKGSGVSDSELAIVGQDDQLISTASFPDQATNRVPDHMKLVTVGGKEKIYILTRVSSGTPILSMVHRFDVPSRKFDLACPVNPDTYDFDVWQGKVAVSLWRGDLSQGKDVLVFDAETCTSYGTITLPIVEAGGYPVASIVKFTAAGLHIAGSGNSIGSPVGIWTYDPDTLQQKKFLKTATYRYRGAVGNGKLYTTEYGGVYETDPLANVETRVFPKGVSAGVITVIEAQ